MPKALVLGNGNLLVGLDQFGQVRDFYFPYVGIENQTSAGCTHRIGVWIDDQFSWLDDGSWSISVDYAKETLRSIIRASSGQLALEIDFHDVVYNEKNIFMREVHVRNKANHFREIRLFMGQQFHLYGTMWGDTAYYDPDERAIIHYKGKRVVIVGGEANDLPFQSYSVGLFGIEGREGTFRDAEDGVLGGNGVEHGAVDSIIGFTIPLEREGEATVHYWLAAATSLKRAKNLHHAVLAKTPEHIIETTSDFWYAWVNKSNIDFADFPISLVTLFKKSLLILRTHVNSNGAIIASADADMLKYGRDSYAYVWPRDGAFAAVALDRAGYADTTRHFFSFSNDIVGDHGYFFHKYRPDKSLGSSWHPWIKGSGGGVVHKQLGIQEDGTALVLWALWEHYRTHADLEFIERVYNTLIKRPALFLTTYRDERRLPQESYDLWEEKYGISTFTAAAVYGGLAAASHFAHLLGKEEDDRLFSKAAQEIRDGIMKHLYIPENNFFLKRLIPRSGESDIRDETLDMSSFFGVFRFGVLELNDERLQKGFTKIIDWLCCKTPIGGAVRYEGDRYYRSHDDVPGNPWIITTLWFVQYMIAQAKEPKDLKEPLEWLSWVERHALKSGMLPEQLDPYSGEHLSASPLVWSHAEYIITVLDYLQKQQEFDKKS
jgi:glucoamylase